MRLIDGDEFAKKLREDANTFWGQNERTWWCDALTEIADDIDNAPEIEIEKAVRCIECKRRDAKSNDGKYTHCGMFYMWMPSDFFCGNGIKEK